MQDKESKTTLRHVPGKVPQRSSTLKGAFVFGLLLAMAATGCQGKMSPDGKVMLAAATTSLILESDAAPVLQPAATIAGTSSCSSRGCHGKLLDTPEIGPASWTSYSRWLRDDPHAGAFQSLFSPLAAKMGTRLGMEQVANEPRCIACHATPQAAADASWAKEERLFGVGCESCHGAATKWLEPHKSKSWSGLTGADKDRLQSQYGMNRLGNLRARALVCAGCHVGSPAKPDENLPLRDVDHELIAAGHPRLAFEFGAYLANEPKHWIEKDKSADFEARAWALGQLASAEAALELFIDRALSQRNWPEFAENDCFACHHELDRPSWRQANASPEFARLRLNRWYYSLVDLVAERPLPLAAIDKTLARSQPTANDTAQEAKRLLASLREMGAAIEREGFSSQSLARLRAKLAMRGAEGKDLGWDELEQIALGIKAVVASERGWLPPGTATDPLAKIDKTTDALLQKLAFPAHTASPLPFRRSPGFDRELIRLFESLR